MFDDIIIVDYKSTDNSIEICKSICPNCKIIETRNSCFDALEVDKEIMDIENTVEGIKVVLNVTEFLICEKSVNDIFINNTTPISYSISSFSPYSLKQYNINNYEELFSNLLNFDVVYHKDRSPRQIHNFSNGNYHIGRHVTNNKSIPTDKSYIIWFGYYPMNDNLLKRKLQIQGNIPQSDKDKGFGVQHISDKNTLLFINKIKSESGVPLNCISHPLYNLVYKINKTPKKYRAVILVLASNFPNNKLYREVWKQYMFRDNSFKVLFIYGKSDRVLVDYNKDYDIIAKYANESLGIPKVLEAFKIIEERFVYDYLVRTNISTFWDFAKLHKHLDSLPKQNCYSGDGPLDGRTYNKNGFYLSGVDTIVTPEMISSINRNHDKVDINRYCEDQSMGLYFNGVLGAPMLPNRICFFEDITSTNQTDLIRSRIDDAILNDKDHYRVKNLNGNREELDKCVYKELLKKIYDINIM
jgi:hypothetical protein